MYAPCRAWSRDLLCRKNYSKQLYDYQKVKEHGKISKTDTFFISCTVYIKSEILWLFGFSVYHLLGTRLQRQNIRFIGAIPKFPCLHSHD